MSDANLLSIGEIAQRAGTSVSAIRFYCDRGMLIPIRGANAHRYFKRADLRRVSFILIAQSLGYGLTRIQQVLASLPDQRTPTKSDWQKLSRQFSKDIDQRISQLELLKDKLDGCIGCGCLSLKNCQLYNPDDRIAIKGAGPRYLLGDK